MQLLTPEDLKKELPLSKQAEEFVQHSRLQAKAIFDRRDPRLLFIIGPCSIHNVDEALAFGKKLKELSREVEDRCMLIMRTSIEKPRTSTGWKGLVHDPHLNDSADLSHGLRLARSLFLELATTEQPIAMEFLSPTLAPYLEDLVTFGWIGARTTSSQNHRILASDLPMPIGFKNSVDGNIESAIHGVNVARHSHTYLQIDETGRIQQKKTAGNPHALVILRGSTTATNYDRESVQETLSALRQLELPPRVLIDCSHGNCSGKYYQQKEVFQSGLEQIQEGNQQILGMMLETHLEAASQKITHPISDLQPGVSITDPCLDFATMAELVQSSSSMVMSST